MKKTILIFVLLCLVFSQMSFAQMEPMKRGEELEKLNVFIGGWALTNKMAASEMTPGGEGKGESGFSWLGGKIWMRQTFSADFMPGWETVWGEGLTTWDAGAGEYIQVWVENFMPAVMEYRGNWVDEKTLVLKREAEFQGQKTFERITWKIVSDKELHFTMDMSADGKTYNTMFESIYTKGM